MKQQKISKSCDNCKKKKVACQGVKPTCPNCQHKKLTCNYSIMKKPGLKPGYGKKFNERLNSLNECVKLCALNFNYMMVVMHSKKMHSSTIDEEAEQDQDKKEKQMKEEAILDMLRKNLELIVGYTSNFDSENCLESPMNHLSNPISSNTLSSSLGYSDVSTSNQNTVFTPSPAISNRTSVTSTTNDSTFSTNSILSNDTLSSTFQSNSDVNADLEISSIDSTSGSVRRRYFAQETQESNALMPSIRDGEFRNISQLESTLSNLTPLPFENLNFLEEKFINFDTSSASTLNSFFPSLKKKNNSEKRWNDADTQDKTSAESPTEHDSRKADDDVDLLNCFKIPMDDFLGIS